jgi:acyl-CoA synthetase (AMP-forming)/AMP-acid ligase II
VLGRPDEVTGEAVHAYVVAAAGRTPDPDTLRRLVEAALGRAAVPRTIRVIDRVPLAPSGKPDKGALAG